MTRVCAVFSVLVLVASFSVSAFAANGTWNNTGVTSASWINPDNWSLGVVPGSTSGTANTDTATFNTAIGGNSYGTSANPVIIDSNRNIGGLNFDTAAGNYFIGSTSLNPLLLTSGGTTQILGTLTTTDAFETINAPLVIEGASGTYTFQNNSANGNGPGAGWLIIGGSISGVAAGNTVLTLSGSNMNANTISGAISNGGATSLAITKNGTGTWVLSGANAYSGPTTVNSGTLEAGVANQAFGNNSTVTVAGAGTLDLGGFNETIGTLLGAGTVTSSAAGAPILTISKDNAPTAFSGIIQNGNANSVGLTVQGSGSLTLSGANTYSGATTVSAGKLVAGIANQAFGIASAVSVSVGGTLDLAGFNEAIGSLAGGGTVTNSGAQDVTLMSGSDNTSTTFSGVIQNGNTNIINLNKVGNGILTLSSNNTYSGTTTLTGGELDLGATNAISPATVFFNGGTLQYSAVNHLDDSSQFSTGLNQAFSIDTNGQNVAFADPLTSSGGTLTKIGNGTLTLLANSNYSGMTTITGGTLQIGNGGTTGSLGAGDVTDNADLTFDLINNPNISNAITGTGSVTQIGTGTVTLSGANTYSGATTVTAGTLKAGILNQAFGLGSAVSVGVVGTLDLAGLNETIGSLADSGLVTSTAPGTPTLTTGTDNTDTEFLGSIQNGSSASVGLTKVGTGTFTLSGVNTYTGATTLIAGILNLNNNNAIGPGTINFFGGTLQYSDNNNNDYSSQFSTVNNQFFNIDTNGQDVAFASPLTSIGGSLTKLGDGTLTLLVNSNYSTGTTISGGTLQIGNGGTTGSLGIGVVTDNADLTFDLSSSPIVTNFITGTGSVTQNGTGTVTLSAINFYTGTTDVNAGTLKAGAVNQAFGFGSAVTVGVGGTLDIAGLNETIGSLAGGGLVTSSAAGTPTLTTGIDNTSTDFSGSLQNGSSASVALTKTGTGTLTLSGDNTYTGATTLIGGTLDLNNSNALGPGTINFNGGTLQYSANNNNDYSSQFSSASNQAFNIDTNGQSVTFASSFSSAGGVLAKSGSGTLTLTNANNYTGATLISAGTLQVQNANALGTGPVTNNGTLALGTTSLSLGGAYNQNANSTLSLSIYSTSNFGNIEAPSVVVDPGSAINVHIIGYAQNNAQYEIINSGGTGIGSVPLTINSDNRLFSFTGSIIGGNLFLTADNVLISLANNPNALALANVLANETNPSSDLQTALSDLVHLTNAQITGALNTMGPIVNGGIIQDTSASLNNFLGASLDRVRNVLSREEIIDKSLNDAEGALNHPDHQEPDNGIWAKPYGSFLGQSTRQYIPGYEALNAGTVIGADSMVGDNIVLGISGGYAYGQVDTDQHLGNTDISSAQSTVYAGYLDPNHQYYVDAAGSVAWNWYDGKRNISYINRTADSKYDGQQYGTYIESGYRFNSGVDNQSAQFFGNGVDIVPLISLQWTHMGLGGYTETNAGALDLNVQKQDYDMLESGVGFSVGASQINDWGIFTPEVHFKWLHDYIDDHMAVTSSFTGGGGTFTANGLGTKEEGIDFGGKLSFDLKKDISLIADCDILLRGGFVEVYGSGTVRYKF